MELRGSFVWLQGSGFPTLHREEIDFVEASIAYARGEPVVSDEEYENLKTKVQCLYNISSSYIKIEHLT